MLVVRFDDYHPAVDCTGGGGVHISWKKEGYIGCQSWCIKVQSRNKLYMANDFGTCDIGLSLENASLEV